MPTNAVTVTANFVGLGAVPNISVSPTTVTQGGSITFTGLGFTPNTALDECIDSGSGVFCQSVTATSSGAIPSGSTMVVGTNVPAGQRSVYAQDHTLGKSNVVTITVTSSCTNCLVDMVLPSPNGDTAFHYWARQVPANYYTANQVNIDQTILIHYKSTKALMSAWGITSVASLGSGCANNAAGFGVGVFSVLFDGARDGQQGGSGLDRCEEFVGANTQYVGSSTLLWSRGVIVGETVNTIMAGFTLGGSGSYPRTWFTDDIWYFPAAVTGEALVAGGYGGIANQWLSSECYTACGDTSRYNANSAYAFWSSFTLSQLGSFLSQIRAEGLNLGVGKLAMDESACGPSDNYVNDPGLSIKSTYLMVLLAYTSGQDIKSKLPSYQVVGGMCSANPISGWHSIKVDGTMYDAVKLAHSYVLTLSQTDQNWSYWRSGTMPLHYKASIAANFAYKSAGQPNWVSVSQGASIKIVSPTQFQVQITQGTVYAVEVLVDGAPYVMSSGGSNTYTVSVNVPSGTHTVQFQYQSTSGGSWGA